MKNKKAILLCNYYFPFVGGCKYYQAVAEGLAKKGYSVTVWTPQRKATHSADELLNGVTIRRFKMGSLLSVWLFIFRNIAQLRKSDIVHGFDYNTILFWYFPFRFLFWRKPVFVTFLGHEGRYPLPKRFVFMRKIAEVMTWGNICGGDYLKVWYKTKPDFIAYGGCEEPARKSEEPKEPSAVFIGRVQTDSGIMEYVKAIGILKSKGRPLSLDIYGSIPDQKLFESIMTYVSEHNLPIKHLGIAHSVEETIQKYKYAFFSACLANMEAMICRRLVFSVYSNPLKKDYLEMVPGARSMNEIVASSEQLAERIRLHLDNPSLSRDMINKAFRYAKEQTWEKVAEVHGKLFEKKWAGINWPQLFWAFRFLIINHGSSQIGGT